MHYLVHKLLIVINFVAYSECSVVVDFGHWKQPFVSEENGVTILKNEKIVVQLRCKANYPTQWIFNFDDDSRNIEGRYALQWTDRKFSESIDAGVYDYIAWVQLQFDRMVDPETYICAAVDDPLRQDRITVKLVPVEPDKTTVSITQTQGYKDETPSIPAANSSCEVKFSFLDGGAKGLFWKCRRDDGNVGTVSFRECGSAMQCQNSFRNIKRRNKCLTIAKEPVQSLNSWIRMETGSFPAGTALCKFGDTTRAQSYFYSAPVNGRRKVEFTWSDLKPEDLVWMDDLNDEYFTGETISVVCHFPKFGFSFDPYGSLLLNGTRIRFEPSTEESTDNTWVSQFKHDLSEPGSYVVQCLAPVWNTTEWVNKTKNFTVKFTTPPFFDKYFENITFTEGETTKKLECIARGEPKPDVRWENVNLPIIMVNGPELTFQRVTDYLAGSYVCVATNRFGQSTRKVFNIQVAPRSDESGIGLGVTSIVAIFSAVLIVIVLIIGFVVFYRKFHKLSGQIAYLTYEEVEHFRDGNMVKDPNGDANLNNSSIECMPYNSKYDVSKEQIYVDESKVLGAGAYGTVLKGTIKITSYEEPKLVAFKTVLKTVDVSYFKALLSELKILAHIGDHPNVVCLVGAYTENIKHREIYVGVELCKTSILAYLRDNTANFTNDLPDARDYANTLQGDSSAYENFTTQFSAVELLQWAQDIATGMDFLALKRVVHGDLAARNVLLSFEMQAKICDFGLARQLIDYNYIKSQSCPLPWKWMAIESLNQMKFSTQSDVWAFGVTLWEIFSMGNIPYPGMTWRADFVEKLQGGLRMSCPLHANEIIYNLMRKCWAEDPKERPNFTEILKILKSQSHRISEAYKV